MGMVLVGCRAFIPSIDVASVDIDSFEGLSARYVLQDLS